MGVGHHSTPKKSRPTAYQQRKQVFWFHGVSHTASYRILGEPRDLDPRTFHSNYLESRGRKKKLDQQALKQTERCIDKGGFDGRTLPWEAIPAAAGLDIEVSARTGPQGKIRVLRRPWERFCPDCIVEKEAPAEKDLRRLHCWAAVGYDFKSPLVWYDVYRDQILEPMVAPWLKAGYSFVLEEDNDSGYSRKKGSNIVTKWKRENSLESYFNCPLSLDFVPIEKDAIVKELAEEGWDALKQESINRWVDQVPQILKSCIDSEGAMTGH
ncbi:hypothetical protein C8A01DRAFT_49492 [Parachaetomium inaequale]|uniref:Uncharacterized protein n=1 Tax=Parachaetomium inaequale TaxID=2588326 RepID=A0AAN6PAW1_9PEZI|nr:hypothetical protein C8A01DRAFT_49492 [Parachaetomium inaequale]